MRKLTILVDMDDVLNNLIERWVEELNILSGTSVAYEDITDWDITLFYPTLTTEQTYSPLQSSEFWSSLSTLPGSVETLKRLMDDGHTIRIVTASHYKDLATKMEWLFKYYPFLGWNSVIVAHDKKLIQGDILIDDAPHNLVGGSYNKILFSSPHNLEYDATANDMSRVNNWAEVYATTQELPEPLPTTLWELYAQMPRLKRSDWLKSWNLTGLHITEF